MYAAQGLPVMNECLACMHCISCLALLPAFASLLMVNRRRFAKDEESLSQNSPKVPEVSLS